MLCSLVPNIFLKFYNSPVFFRSTVSGMFDMRWLRYWCSLNCLVRLGRFFVYLYLLLSILIVGVLACILSFVASASFASVSRYFVHTFIRFYFIITYRLCKERQCCNKISQIFFCFTVCSCQNGLLWKQRQAEQGGHGFSEVTYTIRWGDHQGMVQRVQSKWKSNVTNTELITVSHCFPCLFFTYYSYIL